MKARPPVVCLVVCLGALPAPAKSAKTADEWVAQARLEISADRYDVARKDLRAALEKAPDHADAHFLLCGLELAEADRLVRGFGTQEQVDYELYDAGTACANALEHNPDPTRRSSLLGSRLRTQIAGRRWSDAASTFEALLVDSPDDGRLVGGYAAMLDRAGKREQSAAALQRAAARGAEFDHA